MTLLVSKINVMKLENLLIELQLSMEIAQAKSTYPNQLQLSIYFCDRGLKCDSRKLLAALSSKVILRSHHVVSYLHSQPMYLLSINLQHLTVSVIKFGQDLKVVTEARSKIK